MSRVYRRLLLLLPRWLRERAGDEMLALHEAKLRDGRVRGRWAEWSVWIREVAGLFATALSARRVTQSDGRFDDSSARRGSMMESLAQDVGYALRTMRRRPTQAFLAVVTCALGIGGASAMFGVVDGVLLRPLPYPEPDRIVSVYPTIEEWRSLSDNMVTAWNETFQAAADRGSFSGPEFLDWMRAQTSFDAAAAVTSGRATLTGLGVAEILSVPQATPGLFALLGAEPVLGRTFGENARSDEREVVVTWGFWQDRLGGAPDVIGRSITLDDRSHEIIGVLPRDFILTGYDGDVWKVFGADTNTNRDDHNLRVIARLAEEVTVERAREESASILRGLSEQHASDARITHLASVFPRLEDETRQVRSPLLLLLAGSALLLLVSCVNFAALRLGAGIDRETELHVRAAIGAGRSRIARQMVTESAVLAMCGAMLGLFLAFAITRALTFLAPAGVPRLDGLRLDFRIVLFAIAVAGVVGIAFGLIPAFTLCRGISDRLRTAHASRGRQRLHAALVMAQSGLATVLLVCAGVLARTVLHLDAVDPGFQSERLLSVRLQPPYQRLRAQNEDLTVGLRAYYADLVRAVEDVPGVDEVALASTLPFSGDRANNEIVPEGHDPETGGRVVAERNAVSGNYLELIGVRAIEGRLLQPTDDRADAVPVAVVSERLARQFWSGGAIGRKLDFWAGSFTVVGVIEDIHDRTLQDDDGFRFYVAQNLVGGVGGSIVVRTAVEPSSLISEIRQRIAQFDADLPVTSVLPMSQRIADSLSEQRYRARLASVFALLAAAFAAFGIYGVTNRSVARRKGEIGIRLALGAKPASVVGRTLRHGVSLAFGGISAGLLVSLAATRAIAAYVYGTQPNDPLTLIVVAAVLVTTAAAACLAPSLRAARTDPLLALRSD